MGKLFNDTMQGLLEAVAIDRGETPLVEREKELIEQMCELRKQKKITQAELAKLTGSKQQVISRTEKNNTSPSLKLFCNMINALGYDLQIVKKA